MKCLRDFVNDYINLRRQLGFKLIEAERLLNDFVFYMESKNTLFITIQLAVAWAKKPKNALQSCWGTRLSVVRKFSYYINTIDSRNEIIPYRLLNYSIQRGNPHIYSDDQISKLLKACLSLKSKQGIRSYSYYTIIGLLAVTGLRVSEVTSIMMNDMDLIHGRITISKSKKQKSRIIPLHKSTLQVLYKYLLYRNKISVKDKAPYLFISELGTRITSFTVRSTFIKLSHETGLRKPTDSFGPRLHDLRHTFAVKTIIQWYEKKVDVDQNMPILSTYLGHTKVSDTYWYLSLVPELVMFSGKRLEKYLGENK